MSEELEKGSQGDTEEDALMAILELARQQEHALLEGDIDSFNELMVKRTEHFSAVGEGKSKSGSKREIISQILALDTRNTSRLEKILEDMARDIYQLRQLRKQGLG